MSAQHRGTARFVICRCGQAFPRDERHVCLPKEVRDREYPNLYTRWLTDGPATERELNRLGEDPMFCERAQQRDLLE